VAYVVSALSRMCLQVGSNQERVYVVSASSRIYRYLQRKAIQESGVHGVCRVVYVVGALSRGICKREAIKRVVYVVSASRR